MGCSLHSLPPTLPASYLHKLTYPNEKNNTSPHLLFQPSITASYHNSLNSKAASYCKLTMCDTFRGKQWLSACFTVRTRNQEVICKWPYEKMSPKRKKRDWIPSKYSQNVRCEDVPHIVWFIHNRKVTCLCACTIQSLHLFRLNWDFCKGWLCFFLLDSRPDYLYFLTLLHTHKCTEKCTCRYT